MSSTSRSRRILREAPGALRRAGRKLRALRPGEVLLLVQAPVLLPLAALALRQWGLQHVQALLGRRPAAAHRAPAGPGERHAAAERIAWTVQVSAAYGPWPANCLQRSVVLWWFLRRRGLEGDLRIGVRRDAERGLDFHAWVEHAGRVINDRRDVRQRYATFDQAIAPRDASFT